ncbi:MAG: hypothetical protein DRI77_13780, partial [Chloroflexi bacterium]
GVYRSGLGLTYYSLGQFKRAIRLHKEALDIAREIGDRWGEVVSLGNLGSAYRAMGQINRAIGYYEQCLAIDHEIGDRRAESNHLGNLGSAYYAMGQFERAKEFHELALVIARKIGNRRGESYRLLGLGKALLATGELFKARQRCAKALALDVPETSYQAALVLGIVLLYQSDEAARDAFTDAAARCRALLDKTAGLYAPRYALAAALVGQAVCDPRWADESKRDGLLAPALAEYRRALENCAAQGVVQDALRDLELIRAAGIEGLEPVFELLESVCAGNS